MKICQPASDRAAHRPRISQHGSKGFTLVEVILALALTATLLGLLSTGVYVVARDWNSNSDRLDRNLDRVTALQRRIVRGQLQYVGSL